MRFSIRQLMVTTVLIALLTQAIMSKIEVMTLEAQLDWTLYNDKPLALKASALRQKTLLCKTVLKSYEQTSSSALTPRKCFEIANERFKHLKDSKADQ